MDNNLNNIGNEQPNVVPNQVPINNNVGPSNVMEQPVEVPVQNPVVEQVQPVNNYVNPEPVAQVQQEVPVQLVEQQVPTNEVVQTVETPVQEPVVNNVPNTNIENINQEQETDEPVKKEVKPREIPAAEKNFKLTSTLLIIFFVLLLAYIIAMPYIGDWILAIKDKLNPPKEPEVVTPTPSPSTTPDVTPSPSPKEELKKITCTSPVEENEEYTKITKIVYEYKNDLIIKATNTYTYEFTSEEVPKYKEVVDDCNDSIKYLGKSGLTVSCNIQELNVVVENSFDLETFVPIYEEDVQITAGVLYKQELSSKKEALEEVGYICE